MIPMTGYRLSLNRWIHLNCWEINSDYHNWIRMGYQDGKCWCTFSLNYNLFSIHNKHWLHFRMTMTMFLIAHCKNTIISLISTCWIFSYTFPRGYLLCGKSVLTDQIKLAPLSIIECKDELRSNPGTMLLIKYAHSSVLLYSNSIILSIPSDLISSI